MSGHEIDAGVWAAPAAGIKVTGTGDAVREFSDLASVAFPVRTNGIAIPIIPFGPSDRKFPNLVAAFA
jgi:hypothetical protein